MRILFVHDALELGGTEHVAIDWARGLRDRGHAVVFSSRPGTLDGQVRELGFEHLIDTSGRLVPHHAGAARLREIVRQHRIDLVHSFVTSTARSDLESFFGPHLRDGTPLVLTALFAPGIASPWLIPRTVPVIVGRPTFARQFERHGRPVFLVRPSLDVREHRPGRDGSSFRARCGVGHDEPLVLLISRVPRHGPWVPSVVNTIDAIGEMPPARAPRLVIVGYGDGEGEVLRHVEGANRRIGHEAVQFIGPVSDLIPAYAAADVVVGMATTALRAMACAVPTIVLGLGGTASIAAPSLLDQFLAHGVFAAPDGPSGPHHVAGLLGQLLDDRDAAKQIGAAGRVMMVAHWSTDAAVDQLERAYAQIVVRRVSVPARAVDALDIAARHLAARARIRLGLRTRVRRLREWIGRPTPGPRAARPRHP